MNFKGIIKQWLFERYEVPTLAASIRRLKASGFYPKLWLDVGAHHGDVADLFCQTWPEAKGLCFEGQAEPLKTLQARFQGNAKIQVIPKLAGASSKKKMILRGRETSASVLEEEVHPQLETQQVEMTTLDQEVTGLFQAKETMFIKIDTQGYELEILRGAGECLKQTGALILELNFLEIHKNVPLGDEIIAWLKERKFVVYDVAGLTRRPKNRSLWQADFVFVPQNSPLREDKSYE